jgi:hypothetical protein
MNSLESQFNFNSVIPSLAVQDDVTNQSILNSVIRSLAVQVDVTNQSISMVSPQRGCASDVSNQFQLQ